MPDPHSTDSPPRPTSRQLAYLRSLANRAGQTFAYPRTSAEASREIRRLRGQKPMPRADRVRERREISADLATRSGDDSRVRAREIEGYGSSAAWSAL